MSSDEPEEAVMSNEDKQGEEMPEAPPAAEQIDLANLDQAPLDVREVIGRLKNKIGDLEGDLELERLQSERTLEMWKKRVADLQQALDVANAELERSKSAEPGDEAAAGEGAPEGGADTAPVVPLHEAPSAPAKKTPAKRSSAKRR